MTAETTTKTSAAAIKKSLPPVKKTASRSGTGKIAIRAMASAGKAKPVKADKKDKHKKTGMVRDSYSMTEDDYANLIELKKKCIAAGIPVKKSELLRAGLAGLMKLSNASLLASVKRIVVIKNTGAKTGR